VFHVEQAIAAIKHYPNENLKDIRKTVAASRAEAIKLADLLNLEPTGSDTAPFLWTRIERRRQAVAVAWQLYRRGRMLVIPGIAFGNAGEGFLRFSLTASADNYVDACERVKRKPRLFTMSKEK